MKIVAEIGNAHEGSLGMALAYIDAVADAGADAVKFQCHDGDPVSEFRPGTFFPQDATRQDYWRRVGFTRRQWNQLKGSAVLRAIDFGISVFSREGLKAVGDLADFIKIPSGRMTSADLLLNVAHARKPVVISTGMASEGDILGALSLLRQTADPGITLLQCTSEYPTPPEHIGLGTLKQWLTHWTDCNPGISDHSGTIWPSIAAATLGADMAEVHVCFSRQQWGPDVSSSITIEELRQLVQGVRFIEKMQASTLSKDDLAAMVADNRRIFGGA